MNVFKIDTHVHTAETSPCGHVSAAELVRLYKAAGYDGIIITDHYYDNYFECMGKKPWEDKIDLFLTGYKNALEAAKTEGLQVLLGMELRFGENFNDYLVFGIDEVFLKENKKLYRLGLKKFKKLASKNGLLVYQAHPFRTGMIPASPSLLDGVEIYNGNPRHNSYNVKALAFARENGLLMISGSDFHKVEDLARGGIELKKMASDSKDLPHILSGGNIKIHLQSL